MTAISESHYQNQRYNKQEEKRSRQIAEIRDNFDKQIITKEKTADTKLENVKKAYKEEKQDVVDSFNVTLSKSQKDMKSEIAKENFDSNREIVKLKESFEAERRIDKKEFQTQLKNLRNSFDQVVENKDRVIEQLKIKNEKKITNINERNDSAIKAMRLRFEDKIDKLHEKNNIQMRTLVDRYRNS